MEDVRNGIETDDEGDEEGDANSDETVIPRQENAVIEDEGPVRSSADNEDNASVICEDAVLPNSIRNTKAPTFALNFRDIEESVRPFDGSSTIPIEVWVDELEETAALFQWSELQTLIFAKKSLTDLAKLFMSGEKGVNSWEKLKAKLLKEFESKVNSRDIHKQLEQRTMNKEETALEYFYVMRKMASRGNMGERDLINYVIDGFKDASVNKQMLYGARDLTEFKRKLQDYEECTKKRNDVYERCHEEVKRSAQKKALQDTNSRCYNCGQRGHKAPECRIRAKGATCFKCNNFGHMA